MKAVIDGIANETHDGLGGHECPRDPMRIRRDQILQDGRIRVENKKQKNQKVGEEKRKEKGAEGEMKSLRHVTVPLARHGGEQELFAYSAYFLNHFASIFLRLNTAGFELRCVKDGRRYHLLRCLGRGAHGHRARDQESLSQARHRYSPRYGRKHAPRPRKHTDMILS